MRIAGLDLSMNSSGCVKWDIGDMQNSFDYLGFTSTHKWSSSNILSIKKLDFKTRYHETEWFLSKIIDFVKDADYIATEGNSFASTGLVFEIGAFVGVIKYELFKRGCKFIDIPPTVHKKYSTGNGKADKVKTTDELYKRFPWLKKHSELGLLPEYKSPQADIMDAVSLCYTLEGKLKLMNEPLKVNNFDKEQLEVLRSTSKTNKIEFWKRDFVNGEK